jgi:NADH:ubiquinone oxidoreductase subunit F (NADH-binding)
MSTVAEPARATAPRLLDPGAHAHRGGAPTPTRRPQRELIELVAEAGLRGRGGAGFPTARKLQAVAGRRGPRIVVVNATEGEPGSAKDRTLLLHAPHLVLDGAVTAAAAVGAEQVIVCVDRADRQAARALESAVAERAARGERAAIDLVGTPTRYVAGEETALVRFLNGGEAKPQAGSPRPFDRGVDGCPTLIQNVETLAHLALIARRGSAWFRETGTADEPGTTLLTITGAVASPCVCELPVGTPVGRILQHAGGPSEPLQALLVGGFWGTWLGARGLDAPFSRAGLAPHGASPGAGVLIALPAAACGLTETARILRWYADESAGQCGPCVFGLADIARTAAALAAGRAGAADVERLERWAAQIERRGACGHPDGAVRLMRSALRTFADDVRRHARGMPCVASRHPARVHVPATVPGWG